MAISTVFNNNRTQAVRLPAEMRFPDLSQKGSSTGIRSGAHYRACGVGLG